MKNETWWLVGATWFAGAALSGPLGVVLHELAHFGVAAMFGFPEVTLHAASISYARSEEFWSALAAGDREAAALIYPLQQAGFVSLAGPIVTLLLSLGAALMLRVRAYGGLWAGLLAGFALMASIRSLTGVYYILFVRPNYPGARPFFDEINAARAFEMPVDWIVWPSIATLALCWFLAAPQLRPRFWLKLPAVILGPIVGIAAWAFAGSALLK